MGAVALLTPLPTTVRHVLRQELHEREKASFERAEARIGREGGTKLTTNPEFVQRQRLSHRGNTQRVTWGGLNWQHGITTHQSRGGTSAGAVLQDAQKTGTIIIMKQFTQNFHTTEVVAWWATTTKIRAMTVENPLFCSNVQPAHTAQGGSFDCIW